MVDEVCVRKKRISGSGTRSGARAIPSDTDILNKAAIFVAITRAGSFASAAATLGMARSTVSQHVSTLEDRLGVRLIERSTRKLRLTDEGELLYERMSVALSSWQDVLDAFEARRQAPAGTLRVSCPGGIASSLVGPLLADIMREHPDIDVQLYADDRIADLLESQIDVAIRMASLVDSRLVARLLFHDQRILVCSPTFAARLPARRDVELLSGLPWVGHSRVSGRTVWVRQEGQGGVEIRPTFRAHGSTTEALLTLAAGDIGVALIPSVLVREHLASGALIHVFNDIRGRELPIYAVYPARKLLPARTRLFLDRLVAVATESSPSAGRSELEL